MQHYLKLKKKVTTCVMREGEDGVPDAVTHIDVEHPEVHSVFRCPMTMT